MDVVDDEFGWGQGGEVNSVAMRYETCFYYIVEDGAHDAAMIVLWAGELEGVGFGRCWFCRVGVVARCGFLWSSEGLRGCIFLI